MRRSRGPGVARGAVLPGSETALVSAVREAINLQPGARLRRNNSGKLEDKRGRWVAFGQGVGSPDLMGAVTIDRWIPVNWTITAPDMADLMGAVTIDRWIPVNWTITAPDMADGAFRRVTASVCFHLECKLPGEKLSEDQEAWHAEARRRGEFVAIVHSVEEALAALARCRAGAVE